VTERRYRAPAFKREPIVTSDEEFRKQAADAQAMADKAHSALDQESWLRIARGFMQLIRGVPSTPSEEFEAELQSRGTNQDDSMESH
jgi:hypothetical protein